MKIATLVPRLLLGLMFLVFGLNPIPELPSGGFASGAGRTVPECSHSVALRSIYWGRPSHSWRAVACEPLCAAGTYPTGAGNREHPAKSPAFGPCGCAVSNYRHDILGSFVFSASSILLRPVCAADPLSIAV
jgi:hypothetical protein